MEAGKMSNSNCVTYGAFALLAGPQELHPLGLWATPDMVVELTYKRTLIHILYLQMFEMFINPVCKMDV